MKEDIEAGTGGEDILDAVGNHFAHRIDLFLSDVIHCVLLPCCFVRSASARILIMPVFRPLLVVLAAVVAVGPSRAAVAVNVRLTSVDASDVPCAWIGVARVTGVTGDGRALLFRLSGGQPQRLPLEDAVRISFGRSAKAAETDAQGAFMVLAGGDLLAGQFIGGRGETITFKSHSLGEFQFALDRVRALLLPPASATLRASLREALVSRQARPPRDDVIFFADGNKAVGTIVVLARDTITFESDAGEQTYPYQEIAALVVSEQDAYVEPQGVIARLVATDGSRVSGHVLRLDDQALTLRTLAGRELRVELLQVAEVRFRGGRLVYVSDLDPLRSRFIPLIEGEPSLWTLRRDANVLGGPLRLGGRRFAKGLGMHSKSRVVYALDEKYRRLLGQVGIDDGGFETATATKRKPGTAPRAQTGNVIFRVEVDGRRVFDSGPRRLGDAPLALDVAVAGGKRLLLEVDFGPDGDDIGDHANWAELRLIR